MKPFKVNRDSWHYKLNKKVLNDYEWHMENWEAKHNNFCSYWRVTLFRLLGVSLFTATIGLVLGLIGNAAYNYPLDTLKVVLSLVAILAIVIGAGFIGFLMNERAEKKRLDNIPDSLFVAKYKSYKSKVCPSVEFSK